MVAVLALSATLAFGQERSRFAGLSLSAALRALQAEGLRVVFTSTIVTPDLRVRSEPRSSAPRRQLDELLAPHGLRAREGPGGIIQVVRAEPARVESGAEPSTVATGAIEGRVVHAFSGAPLSSVLVQVDGTTLGASSDANGRFLMRGVEPGSRTIRASTAGYDAAARAISVARGRTAAVTLALTPRPGTHTEHVTVSGQGPARQVRGVASETTIERGQLMPLHGATGDDLFRTVQALPRVAALDDFRSEFAVRGSPFRHVEVVVDGVATPWLFHTAYGRGTTGSVAMLTGQVLEEATLRAGAYPHRYSDRLGAQLELAIREGSRADVQLRGAIGGPNATVVGEGPIGRSDRGSWLVATRQSYLEWPMQDETAMRTAFGFSDTAAKLVYDVRPSQQLAVTLLAGVSSVDEEEDNRAPNELGEGGNRTSVVNLGWRSIVGAALVLRQRAYIVNHDFLNKDQAGQQVERGGDREAAYRTDVTRPIGRALLETGAQIGRSAVEYVPPAVAGTDSFSGSSWTRSAYAHVTWPVTSTLTLSPGLRVSGSTLLPHRTASRWVLGEWSFRPQWALTASAGVSYQPPELLQVREGAGAGGLRPERARYVDVSLEQRVASSIRWQATFFNRAERDILREPDLRPRLVDGRLVGPPADAAYANVLRGSASGIELQVDRRAPLGLSGWAAYSYGKTRYTDIERHETYWADLDQRHAMNIAGVYAISQRTSVGATFRVGSNFPVPGHLVARDGRLFVGSSRNQVRLPTYARLDVRADRAFESLGRRLTLFGEMLNVFNRSNLGLANGSIHPLTGEAIGFTDRLFPRRVGVGVLVEF